jgi:hypothetical protein
MSKRAWVRAKQRQEREVSKGKREVSKGKRSAGKVRISRVRRSRARERDRAI